MNVLMLEDSWERVGELIADDHNWHITNNAYDAGIWAFKWQYDLWVLDHDLGIERGDGLVFLDLVLSYDAEDNRDHPPWPNDILIVSWNGPAAQEMRRQLMDYGAGSNIYLEPWNPETPLNIKKLLER